MNPLLSRQEKYTHITELRKTILLREFEDTVNQKQSRNSLSLTSSNNSSKNISRFPQLKSPTIDAMRKAILTTEHSTTRNHYS